MIFMDMDEPNFIWKNLNALRDMDCIIESEIMEVTPNKRVEVIEVLGRNGELHETFDDYEAYDLKIPGITIPVEKLNEVKRWLSGSSELVTHNDIDKYRECYCSMNDPIEFENEIGVFYTFDVTFRSQPFRKKVMERYKSLDGNSLAYYDHGDETAKPYIEMTSNGGDIVLKINKIQLTLTSTSKGFLFVDNERGLAIQNNKVILTKGDEWLSASPGNNTFTISSNVTDVKFYPRSVWL